MPSPRVRPTREERARWFDAVVVERALDDWLADRRLTSPGRTLSTAERRVVLHALIAVGTTRDEPARLLRVNSPVKAALAEPPPPGSEALAEHRRVEAAVAYLDRRRARARIAARRHPISASEVDRILALDIGTNDVGWRALFNPGEAREADYLDA